MNPLNPQKLLLSKWTAVKPVAKQKHFLVSRVIQPTLPTELCNFFRNDVQIKEIIDQQLQLVTIFRNLKPPGNILKNSRIFLVIATAALFAGNAFSFEQKILFCADSISYNNKFGALECKTMCAKHSDSSCLQNELNNGWVIGSTSPKELNENPPEWGKCACVGGLDPVTQYRRQV